MLDEKQSAELLGGFGPLSSFSSRISVASGFGLIPMDLAGDLHLVKKIRNRFAHQHSPLRFEEPPISAFVSNLRAVQWLLQYHGISPVPIGEPDLVSIQSSRRRQFEIGFAALAWNLTRAISYATRPEKSYAFPDLASDSPSDRPG